MTSLHEQLREHFPEKVRSVQEQVGGQVTVLVNAPDAVDLARYLLIECATRLVTVFAEDRLNEESLFYIYYIFDRRGRFILADSESPHSRGQPIVPIAGGGVPGGQLAGARDSGLVRP